MRNSTASLCFRGMFCKYRGKQIEKAFRLFFPEFSNKVTWAVVIAGLGLTTTSIFQSIINAVLVTQFNIKILGSYDSLIGVLLISLGLTHNILLQREKTKIEVNYKSETNQKAIDHTLHYLIN
ncbi:hypothetical protein [Psychromonas sp. MME2]|uniref:hypothetical protein n=1 Tax=Psychromonas sp. MME2 TaxID=3231033 RepID=UPI00339D2773